MNNSVQLLSITLCKYHYIYRGFELFPHFLLQLFTFFFSTSTFTLCLNDK